MRRTSQLIAAAALTAVCSASPALAQTASGWGGQVRFTASVDGGIGQTRAGRYVVPLSEDVAEEGRGPKGLALGASVGVEVGRDWAFQLEGQFLKFDQRQYRRTSQGTIQRDENGHLFAGFLTAQYRLPLEGYFRPYIGGGVGLLKGDYAANQPLVAELRRNKREYDFDWAGKFQLGGDFAIGETISLFGQYDLIAPDGRFDETDGLMHVGRVGVKKRF